MKIVDSYGVNYQVTGEREEEAASTLEQGLSAVSKRRNAYIDGNLDIILNDVRHDYGVDVRAVLR